MTITSITQAQIDSGLVDTGYGLGTGQFTYSIPGAGATWPGYAAGTEPFSGYSVLTNAQGAAFRAAIALWDALILPDFTEVADNATTRGELRAAYSSLVDFDTSAYAYSGTPQAPGGKAGDIWINPDMAGEDFTRGTFNFEVLLHEIGHTLGLKHPFEDPALLPAFSYTKYTVMAYADAPGSRTYAFEMSGNSIRATQGFVVQTTPMVLDIAAVQGIYGAETTTRSGDTVYSFVQSDDTRQTLYDAGGNDTIDLSTFTRANDIDLTPGAYSSIGIWSRAEQVAYWSALYPQFASFITQTLASSQLYTHADNLGIAFSTTIENAIGGAGDDRILGNTAANRLEGGGGNDTIDGGGGEDRLIGGGGNDVLTGGAGGDIFVFAASGSGSDRITDFDITADRFDLGGALFTTIAISGLATTLSYSGGTIAVTTVAGALLSSWNARIVGAPVDTTPTFFLLVPTGGAASVQGSGTVFGSIGGTQDVTVFDTPGRIAFDGSFNAGGDRIRLSGNAASYTAIRSGATVTISDGDTSIAVPVGTGGADIVFGDGVRSLTLDLSIGQVRLGGQIVGTSATAITAAAGTPVATGPVDASIPAQLLIEPGATATAIGRLTVFGTIAGHETLNIARGATIALDGSFNAGGDTIVLGGAAATWSAARSGATAILTSGSDSVAIPVGTVGATLRFADGDRTIVIDLAAGAIKIGSQTIGTAPAPVGAAVGATAFSDDVSHDVGATTLAAHPSGHAPDFTTFVL